MPKNINNSYFKTNRRNEKGSAMALILGAIVILGLIGYLGSTIYTSIIGGMQKTNLVVQSSQSLTQAAYTLTTETSRSVSGIPVAMAFTAATFAPNGGGQIPPTSAAPKTDAFGSPLGYCTNNAIGQGDPVFAVISAGSDKTFQTTCAQALTNGFLGDDKILMRNVANIIGGVGGTVYFGDPVALVTDLASLSVVKPGEFRVVTADATAWVNKTGTPGQANWTQVGGTGGSSFVDDVGLIVQASYAGFDTVNTKFLPADGSNYPSASYPLLATRSSPSAIGGTYTITQRTLPATATWSSMTYGKGVFVAVASNSAIAATSPDGVTWTQRTLPTFANWTTVIFGNGLFVATTANSTRAATSPDGINWTNRTMARSQNNVSAAYGNNTYMILASGTTRAQFSSDGINYTSPGAAVLSQNSTDIAFGNNRFVVVENSGGDASSITTDGVNWTYGTILGMSLPWSTVAYGNGRFVTLAAGTNVGAVSTDGVTWTQSTLPSSSNWSNMTFGNGVFTAIATGTNRVIFSSDGVDWVQRTMPIVSNWKNIAYNGSVFSVISNTTGNISATISVSSTNFTVPNITGGYYFIKALP